ncbi:MAG TPA: acyl-CoA dehydrogenase family protein [Povalibacter sp.]|uniref:acyl-CoA dehydrogenase family protein n=1 Tax=Povalibacter sp. TaxID=1962978 RepID=UPI002C3FDF30|nr:acyl-CoA dehydrogenase family protein [Povalibacter sp.]HMN46575.1 acyl-CoA dehydrogenase family protein [Povalibacter sp.]
MLSDVLHRHLHRIESLVRNRAAPDRAADLDDEIADALKQSGFFKVWVPQRYGGAELDLPQTLHLYEAAAVIDGAIGWAVMIGAGGGLFAAYLQPAAAQKLFAPPDAVVAGSGAPGGRAERIGGGYRASGRWRYASGARYATIFTANCVVTENGQPVLNDEGQPLIRAMSFAPADVTIIPAWDTTGMRATGSHDIEVRDVFVASDDTFSVFTDAAQESGLLYRLPFDVLTQLPVAAVASGIARHALDAFGALAAKKSLRQGSPLSDSATVRSQYSRSQARWLAAHLALHALASRTWDMLISRGPPTPHEQAEIAAGCALFVEELLQLVENLAPLAGMDAAAIDSTFARARRDLQTLAAHASVSPLLHERAGLTLLQGR